MWTCARIYCEKFLNCAMIAAVRECTETSVSVRDFQISNSVSNNGIFGNVSTKMVESIENTLLSDKVSESLTQIGKDDDAFRCLKNNLRLAFDKNSVVLKRVARKHNVDLDSKSVSAVPIWMHMSERINNPKYMAVEAVEEASEAGDSDDTQDQVVEVTTPSKKRKRDSADSATLKPLKKKKKTTTVLVEKNNNKEVKIRR